MFCFSVKSLTTYLHVEQMVSVYSLFSLEQACVYTSLVELSLKNRKAVQLSERLLRELAYCRGTGLPLLEEM